MVSCPLDYGPSGRFGDKAIDVHHVGDPCPECGGDHPDAADVLAELVRGAFYPDEPPAWEDPRCNS